MKADKYGRQKKDNANKALTGETENTSKQAILASIMNKVYIIVNAVCNLACLYCDKAKWRV